MVGRGGFEPPKSATADLQSAPFGHSGTYPHFVATTNPDGAGDGTRTRNLLITNQLLCQLSYASLSSDRPPSPSGTLRSLARFCRQHNILYTFFRGCQPLFGIFFAIHGPAASEFACGNSAPQSPCVGCLVAIACRRRLPQLHARRWTRMELDTAAAAALSRTSLGFRTRRRRGKSRRVRNPPSEETRRGHAMSWRTCASNAS